MRLGFPKAYLEIVLQLLQTFTSKSPLHLPWLGQILTASSMKDLLILRLSYTRQPCPSVDLSPTSKGIGVVLRGGTWDHSHVDIREVSVTGGSFVGIYFEELFDLRDSVFLTLSGPIDFGTEVSNASIYDVQFIGGSNTMGFVGAVAWVDVDMCATRFVEASAMLSFTSTNFQYWEIRNENETAIVADTGLLYTNELITNVGVGGTMVSSVFLDDADSLVSVDDPLLCNVQVGSDFVTSNVTACENFKSDPQDCFLDFCDASLFQLGGLCCPCRVSKMYVYFGF